MNRRISFLLLILMGTAMPALRAQTFTEPNEDGVEITYTVISANNVEVSAANYSGRIVVPETVNHEGTTYTVTGVGANAFRNMNRLTFVQLPVSVGRIGTQAFVNSSRLDTLVMLNPIPPTLSANNTGAVRMLFGTQMQYITVVVPSGSLQVFRNAYWNQVTHLTSPSAVPITVMPNNSRIDVNGIPNNIPDTIPTYWYERGDSILLHYSSESNDTLFFGWNGLPSNSGDLLHLVAGPDTFWADLRPVGFGQLAVNNINTLLNACGRLSFHDHMANYFYPADSTTSTLYASGLWIGGLDQDDQVHVCASRFQTPDYLPGPIYRNSPQPTAEEISKYNRLWSVSREEIDDFIANVGHHGYRIPENIMTWPGNHPDGAEVPLAPYYDADSDGYYNPRRGDYPLIRGDRMLFGIFNDAYYHFETGGSPVGVEVHMSAYSFDDPDTALANTVFLSYKVHKRMGQDLHHTYLGAFTDFDIGYAYDDYIGCDVKQSMYYGYNGDLTEGPGNGSYENSGMLPAQSCTFLGGAMLPVDGIDNMRIDLEKMRQYFPESLDSYRLDNGEYDLVRLGADADLYYPNAWRFVPGDTLGNTSINGLHFGNGIPDDERMGMTNFTYYINSTNTIFGDPVNGNDHYNYMRGYWKNGVHITYGLDGHSTETNCTFMFPGDSDSLHWGTNGIDPGEEWTESSAGNYPADRRGIGASGPFIFRYGDSQTLDLAYTTAPGRSDNTWYAVEQLRDYTASVRRQFAHDTTDSGKPFTYRPYSPIPVGVDNNEPVQPTVYPNPTRDRMTVQFGDCSPRTVELYDMTGRLVHRQNCNGYALQLSISHLPAGVYYLRAGGLTTRILKH